MNTNTNETNWRVYLKHNRGILIVGLLFVVFGLWVDVQWFPAHPSATLYFINLLPGALLILAWYSASKYPKSRWIFIGVGVLITFVVSLFIVLLNLGASVIAKAMTPIDDASRYVEVRKQAGDAEIIRHFPLSIPENATNVKFEYLPKFLQGGGHFQLKLNLPQPEIIDLLTEYRSKAKYKFIGGDRSDHANELGGVPTTYFYTSGTDDRSFSETYEILVLNAQPEGNPDFEWNHGYSYGVVISRENSEIVYWAEYW